MPQVKPVIRAMISAPAGACANIWRGFATVRNNTDGGIAAQGTTT
jgi:hypothetical protein